MVLLVRILSKVNTATDSHSASRGKLSVVSKSCIRCLSTVQSSVTELGGNALSDQEERRIELENLNSIIEKVTAAKSDSEVFQFLVRDFGHHSIHITQSLLARLLHRFQDDWKSALGVFRWAESSQGYKPSGESYDKLVDILGKMKQMEKMKSLLEEMHQNNLISLNTMGKAMRRLAGAGDWRESVKLFNNAENLGLEKNTDLMNVLLDTLCKERSVQQARDIFMELKSHILPSANTFNIFIHGWCKIKRVEEAQWTIEEMKGHGFRPCVISYSTIIQFYCSQNNFFKANAVLDEMITQKCPPNVVTFTTLLHSLTKAGQFQEALMISERMKSVGCKPDVLFYNALLHTLGCAGRVEEAIYIFTREMTRNDINPNTSTYNTMISMFCRYGLEHRAVKYLRNLEDSVYCKPDVQSFYPLLKWYFRHNNTDECLALLDKMVKKHHLCFDLATFSLLIHGLCRASKCELAYKLFLDMTTQRLKPRYVTCSLLLQEMKQKHLYREAEVVEGFMKKMK